MLKPSALTCVFAAVLCVVLLAIPQSRAQRDILSMEPAEAQAELERSTREGQRAQARADRLAREADEAVDAADRTAREAASIAARIQAAEADIVAARARFALAQAERSALSQRLAVRRQPLARLTAALQTTSRRPLALSALQPGSLKDLVYVRATLEAAVPEIRARTATLRSELEEGRRIEQRAANALAKLEESEQALQERRAELAELEASQRLASRDARDSAAREGERALALAEEARDLDGLIDKIDDAATLRRELAALPGPIMRPGNLAEAGKQGDGTRPTATPTATPTAAPSPSSTPQNSSRPASFQLPVQGRTITGFGELQDSGLRSNRLSLAPAPNAQVVAPASGRIAFAGPYRGFGRIVIIEHEGGWTSLVTGLDRVGAEVGDQVIAGAPLGVAASEEPTVTIELRRNGDPVNPLNFIN